MTRRCVGFGAALALLAVGASAGELLLGTEGNRLRRFDVDTIGNPKPLDDVFIEAASDGETGGPGPTTPGGRDINGMICRFPDGSGRFVAGEDTGQVAIRPGWGVFDAGATQIGKLVTTYLSNADPRVGEPFGCAFDSQGRLFTTEIGTQALGANNGQLILWFPPYDRFPGAPGSYPNGEISSGAFCKIDVQVGTASALVIDAQDNIYVASPAGFQVLKYAPPFPTGPDAAGGCGRTDATGQPLADLDRVNRSLFIQGGFLETFTGLAFARNGNLYVGQVLGGRIEEYDHGGDPARAPLRTIVQPPPGELASDTTGTPQGLAVGADGTLYYADLNILLSTLQPGGDGKFWRVRFDAKGNPLPPEALMRGLAFPDGVAVFPGDMQVDPEREWRTYAGGPERLFHAADESILTPRNIGLLRERWRHGTNSIVTGSPAVARVELPGEGPTQVVYVQSWDGVIHAVRFADGSVVWQFQTDLQPGAGFPNASSVHVEEIAGEDVVLVGAGEMLYALDAASGQERWRFTAGTGCRDALGNPPGLCGFEGERNQIESSPIVAEGKVFFGMDVNDRALGKGGLYAVDVATGTLAWFFDLESGSTCRPEPGDAITHFDPYHSEAELGLPAGFRARAGCDFPFSRNGCGDTWSSAALDLGRRALFIASSNCDTDLDPGTGEPPPPMPPFDEAIFSLDFDGNVRWRWRPREVDNDDLAFGAVPNLFSIREGEGGIDVVGVGNKDGTYYVLDRDGVNERSGVAWDDADPSQLPYWRRNVVAGGAFGGILATASVDLVRRRVFFGTAPGDSMAEVLNPQLPSLHALDLDSGEIVWDNGTAPGTDATFSPTSSVPGLVFTGSAFTSALRAYQSQDDAGSQKLARRLYLPVGLPFGDAIASGAVVINGTLLTGTGIGFRGPAPNPGDLADAVSRLPSPLVALCVPGEPGCDIPRWRLSDLDDDRDVDADDRALFRGALGSAAGQTAFLDRADLDRDGSVTLADYQRWLAGERSYQLAAAAAACGLLGIEPALLLLALRLASRRRRGQRGS
jgi:outer membrane protein assembly factor BamB